MARGRTTHLLEALVALVVFSPVATAVECRVESVGGTPTLVIDGRPHSGICYSSYDTSQANFGRRAKEFSQAGCNLFNFVVEISGYGFARPMWVGKDQWDFSDLDDRAHGVLDASPNAFLLPRIYVGAPQWWLEENPDERMVLDNGATSFGEKLFALPRAGNYASLASQKWRGDMRRALEAVLDHVEHSDYADRVVGYQLSGQKTEEWYHWSMNCERLGDYSVHMERAFRRWLRDKYHSDDRLQAAWRRPGVTLDTAPIPSRSERIGDRSKTFRDPVRERHVIDFHAFWSEIMADTIDFFARAVKEKTGGAKVVGAFYGYTFEFAELGEDAGHLALGKLLRSPNVDFLMAPSSYFDRNLPGKPYFRAPTASFAVHGKMFWNDFDQVSFKYFDKLEDNPNLATWEWQMGLTRTPEEFVWMNRREIGMTLACGVQTAHFDIHGGYYEHPRIMDAVERLGKIRREALAQQQRGSIAEILLLVDEDSQHYVRFRNPPETPGKFLSALLSAQVAQMGFVAPYDTALFEDLASLDLDRYKLVLVLNAFMLNEDDRQQIRQRLACGGRTIVWLYAPGYFNEHGGDPSNVGRLIGIQVVPDEGPIGAARAISADKLGGPFQPQPMLDADPFVVVDPDAEILATQEDDPTKAVIARRRLGDWTSIYSAAAPLSAAFLKHLAAEAGVHIYDENPAHLLFANRHYLTVAADAAGGEALIRLPRAATVTDLFSGAVLCSEADEFSLDLKPKEVRMVFVR